jgi:hypothetical protein
MRSPQRDDRPDRLRHILAFNGKKLQEAPLICRFAYIWYSVFNSTGATGCAGTTLSRSGRRRIGLHKDRAARLDKNHRRGPIGETKFWSLEFVQFLIEIVIVGVYFSMGLYLNLPAENKKATELPAEDWLTGLLLLIFILYLAWDLIDTRLAGSGPWHEPAWDGAVVTMKSLIPAAAIFVIVLIAKPQTPVPVIILNAWLVILLYAYRFAQDTWGNCQP